MDTSALQQPGPQPGDILADKYRLDSILGAGGMGLVFKAFHLELDRQVAVKFIHAEIAEHQEIATRFLREARAAVQIQSEHVAQVIDVGHTEEGTPYMVMEYLEGKDLSEVLESGSLNNLTNAVDYVIQACSAMLEAHHLGIIHRDLKPANLFVTRRRDGSTLVKVLDFGISKWNEGDRAQHALTNPAALMGSPAYMSPEQLKSASDVDCRSDIWALGMILYELLAGRPAFVEETLPLLITSILGSPCPPLTDFRTDVPPELVQVIERCLEKQPDDRFSSVGELAQALSPFASRRARHTVERISEAAGLAPSVEWPSSDDARPSPSTPRAPRSTDPETRGSWTGEPEPSRGGSKLPLFAVGAALGVVAIATVAIQLQPGANAASTTGAASMGLTAPTQPPQTQRPDLAAPSLASSRATARAPLPATAPAASSPTTTPLPVGSPARKGEAGGGPDKSELKKPPTALKPTTVRPTTRQPTPPLSRTPRSPPPRTRPATRRSNPLEMDIK